MSYSTQNVKISIDGTDRTESIPKDSIHVVNEIDTPADCRFRVEYAAAFGLAENQEVIVSDPGDTERYFAGKITDLEELSFGPFLHYVVTCRDYADDLNYSEAGMVDGMYFLADSHGSNRLTQNNGVSLAEGHVGTYAAQFLAAEQQYLSIADNASLSFGDEDMGGIRWVKLMDKSATYTILGKWNAGGNDREYLLLYDASADRYAIWVSSDGTVTQELDADSFGSPVAGEWNMIYWYHDAGTNELGISVDDGTVDTVSYFSGINDGASTFCIGASHNGATGHANALIGPGGIWRSVPGASIVTSVYNGGAGKQYADLSAGEKADLEAWWEWEPDADALMLADWGPVVAPAFDWTTNVATVDSSVDVEFDRATPLDALRKIAEQAGARWWVGFGPGSGGKTADVYYVDEFSGQAPFDIDVDNPDYVATFPPTDDGLKVLNKRAPNRVIVHYADGGKVTRTVGAEGDYGRWYTTSLNAPNISVQADAEAYGDEWLAKYGPNPTYKFSVREPGLRAGQQIDITDSRRSLSSQSVVIQRVEHRFLGGGYWKTDVTAGRYAPTSPMKKLAQRLGGGGGGGSQADAWKPPSGTSPGSPLSPGSDISPPPFSSDNLPPTGGDSGLAPHDAQYLVLVLDAGLSIERRFVPGTALSATDGGAGADYTLDNDLADEQFLVLALSGDLSAERRFVPGSGLSGVDGGANGDYTLNLDTDLTDEQFLVLALSADLSDERRFVPGQGLSATDGGAGLDYTLANDGVLSLEDDSGTPITPNADGVIAIEGIGGITTDKGVGDRLEIDGSAFVQGPVVDSIDGNTGALSTLGRAVGDNNHEHGANFRLVGDHGSHGHDLDGSYGSPDWNTSHEDNTWTVVRDNGIS